MRPDRTVLLTTVTVLAVVLASGPLVPGVAFTTGTAEAASDYRGFGGGTAGMGVEKRLALGAAAVPDDGRLVRTAAGYRVELDPVELPVETGDRPATFHYVLRIPALEVVDETTERVPAHTARTLGIEGSAPTVPTDRVAEAEYEATLVVSVEDDGWSGTVAEGTVELEVGP
jgi:hypothetical protein